MSCLWIVLSVLVIVTLFRMIFASLHIIKVENVIFVLNCSSCLTFPAVIMFVYLSSCCVMYYR